LPEGITVEQLTDESWQRGRDARKLAALLDGVVEMIAAILAEVE